MTIPTVLTKRLGLRYPSGFITPPPPGWSGGQSYSVSLQLPTNTYKILVL
jgi:hypothetical protein